MKTTHNGFAPIVGVLVLLALLAGGGYYYTSQMMHTEVVGETPSDTQPTFGNIDTQPMPEEFTAEDEDVAVTTFLATAPSTNDDVASIETDISGAEFDDMMASLDADLAGL